jgi:hypothetical protein
VRALVPCQRATTVAVWVPDLAPALVRGLSGMMLWTAPYLRRLGAIE